MFKLKTPVRRAISCAHFSRVLAGCRYTAILVSGGAGYIGSHTCIELLNAGYDVVVADNYYNASPVVLDRVKQITGKDFRFYNADMTRHEDVEKIFTECPDIDAVIQFAAYKAVGESVSKPIEYYYNNLNCTLVILDVMRRHNCKNFVFSWKINISQKQ